MSENTPLVGFIDVAGVSLAGVIGRAPRSECACGQRELRVSAHCCNLLGERKDNGFVGRRCARRCRVLKWVSQGAADETGQRWRQRTWCWAIAAISGLTAVMAVHATLARPTLPVLRSRARNCRAATCPAMSLAAFALVNAIKRRFQSQNNWRRGYSEVHTLICGSLLQTVGILWLDRRLIENRIGLEEMFNRAYGDFP